MKIENYLQKVCVYLNDSHGFDTLMLSFGEGGWDIPLLMKLQSLCTKSSHKYTLWDLGHCSIFLSYWIISGVTLTNAEVVYVPTTTTVESVDATTADTGGFNDKTVIYAAVGGAAGAVLIVIIVAVVIVKMKTA